MHAHVFTTKKKMCMRKRLKKRSNGREYMHAKINCILKQKHVEKKELQQSRNGTKNIRFIFYSQSAVVITIGM